MTASDCVLGIDFGGTKIAVATAAPDGHILLREQLATRPSDGAERALERGIQAGRSLSERTREETGGIVRAVGVATMGITEEDCVYMAPNVPGWDRLAIPGALRAAFPGLPLAIENDVKAAADAELKWGALAGCDTAIYLNLGTGIACGLVAAGHVLRGAHGAAGEIAYNLRHLHEEEGAQQGHAPLEEYVGGAAIADRVASQFGQSHSVAAVFESVSVDPEARAFVERTVTEIAFHLTNLAIALDPERIAVGGGLLRSKDVILPALRAQLGRFTIFPPEVVEAHFGVDAALMGAVALALDALTRA